jgi:hypothetical protein
MSKRKRNILIHPDHVEDLDKKWAELEKNRKRPVRTGYVTSCLLRNTTDDRKLIQHRDILFHRSFIESKMPSRGFIIFKHIMPVAGTVNNNNDTPDDEQHFYDSNNFDSYPIMLQPCKPEWMNRSHVNHILQRFCPLLRRFGFHAQLDSTPPSQILYELGISPLKESQRFLLEEWTVKDEHDGDTLAYRLIPIG